MSERKGDWMQTASGRRFWPTDPRPDEVVIEDIAHALAQEVRFCGHAPFPYTVGQHSVLVSRRAEQLATSKVALYVRQVALWGLLHDAAEAYCKDIHSPLKRSLPEYAVIEMRVLRAITNRFNLPSRMPAEVAVADEEILATEARDLFPLIWHLKFAPLSWRIERMTFEAVRDAFLLRFREVGGVR